ncbi:MAG: CaiB/BaiF CoA-transferase family protein [Sporomusaceae bacterium]|nr:CaiB/BaiF CoA-transferase family protein [Sporomusaceae bacterium]
MKAERSGPLKGVTVLEIANVIAGPFAGSLLADYGADVIKIELPDVGDPYRQFMPTHNGESLRWPTMARNKRCVSLDLRVNKGKEIFLELLKTADIVVENFRPGVIEKWGIGYEVMKRANPKIILVRISGFGQTGPYQEKVGFGTPATAFSGYTYLQGYPDRAPISPPVSLSDYMAGLYGVIGGLSSLTAVLKGDQQEGQVVDVSLYEPLLRLLDGVIAEYGINGKIPERTPMVTGTASPSDMFQTKDNKWVIIVASTQKTWERLAEVMKRVDLISNEKFETNQQRVRNNDLLVGLVGRWVKEFTMTEICELLDANGIPVSPVNSIADIMKNEQCIARQDVISVPHPALGEIKMPNIFPIFSDTPCEVRHPGASLGEHNREVYIEELGLSEEEFRQLEKLKII